MTSYLYLSDIHGNFEALKHLKDLPEMIDPDCQIRFGGDYIDGFDLQPKAIINTLRLIKDLCDNGKAKAIIGNHDDFILKATFKPFEDNWWYLNGQKETLENLGITYSTPEDLREQLIHFYYEELNWLKSLPLYLEDRQNILVHAGFDLDLALSDQDRETMLWTREAYINPPVVIFMKTLTLKLSSRDIHQQVLSRNKITPIKTILFYQATSQTSQVTTSSVISLTAILNQAIKKAQLIFLNLTTRVKNFGVVT